MSEYIGYIGTGSEIVGEITTASVEGSISAGTVILNEYVLTISDITGGHRLTITKGATTQTMDVMDGESPSAYIKTASVSGNTLTLTKQDDTTVTYSGGGGGADAFIVTFTLAAGAQIPTCDKTYAEIVAAEVANKTIIGKLVSSGATDPTVFAYMGRLGSASDAELAFMHLRYALVTMITMGFDSSIGMSSQEFPQKSIVESHMNNAEVHTSAAEKETWNGKQDAPTIKTAMDSVAVAGAKYFLGTQTAVSITMPSDATVGQEILVCFSSGSTACALTCSLSGFEYVPKVNSTSWIRFTLIHKADASVSGDEDEWIVETKDGEVSA